ncbi:MAG: CatA-like O-acetyltransferase [Dysosmobacter sp.]
MSWKTVDMSKDPRRGQFAYFRTLANPTAGVTVSVDVTDLRRWCGERELGFFLPFCYCAERAANAVSELRRRIRETEVVEYDWCPSSHILDLPDGSYCYCALRSDVPFEQFLTAARAAQETARRAPSLELEGEGESEAYLYFSCLPWLTDTAIVQPMGIPADSNPRITWGRYALQEGRWRMPVTLLVHHALADGLHIARFYQALDRELAALTAERG